MEGHEVFRLAVRGCPEIAAAALEKAGINTHEVDVAVPHAANQRIIDAVAKRLDIPADRMVVNLERFGNTSAPRLALRCASTATSTGWPRGRSCC